MYILYAMYMYPRMLHSISRQLEKENKASARMFNKFKKRKINILNENFQYSNSYTMYE